ncbi:MAG TPA: shikimate dehydrogenase [Anaerolineales bacterium]|nr:shikimate dehydrogenase [Anaerolineales bacterium]
MNFELGLIGYPINYSLSPKIHTAALRVCGLEGDYSLFSIRPDDNQALKDLLSRVRAGEIQGLNVTIPHKQNVIHYLDELTPTAQSIGAVNTIYLRNDKLTGDNTDAMGFITDLKSFLDHRQSLIDNTCLAPGASAGECRCRKSTIANRKSVLVLGAGGSARAVVYALLNDGWNVTVAARRPEQALQLASSFPNHDLRLTTYDLSNIQLSNISFIINTTPVGMTPHTEESPWPENLSFPPRAAIYDLVYNPPETKLVREACLQGLRATTGFGMLIEQAALSFEIWTGRKPSRQVLFEALNQTAY